MQSHTTYNIDMADGYQLYNIVTHSLGMVLKQDMLAVFGMPYILTMVYIHVEP